MKEAGVMAKNMAKESMFGAMENDMKEIGKKAKGREKVSIFGAMVIGLKGNGKMIGRSRIKGEEIV